MASPYLGDIGRSYECKTIKHLYTRKAFTDQWALGLEKE
jgi:hypothetical protein